MESASVAERGTSVPVWSAYPRREGLFDEMVELAKSPRPVGGNITRALLAMPPARLGELCSRADFAYLTIAILRLAGVPARYVSGYLAPPPGSAQQMPIASQASHAWIEAQLPGQGWAGFDPTHGCRTDARHIKVAIGRDYSEVTPLRGVYRSFGSKQTMTVDLKLDRETSSQQQSRNGC